MVRTIRKMRWCVAMSRLSTVSVSQARHAVDRGAVLDGRLEHSAVDRLVEAGEQCRTPILAKRGERADERVGPQPDTPATIRCRAAVTHAIVSPCATCPAINEREMAPIPISFPPSPIAIVSHGPAVNRSSSGAVYEPMS